MNDEVELTTLTPGAVTVAEKEKLTFPEKKIIKVHVIDGKFGKFKKEIEDKDTKEKKTILQDKVLYQFEIDDDIQDPKTKLSLQGKTFSKGITLSKADTATYPKFISAVTGTYQTDPATALNKPLQVMFDAETTFNGTAYQPITYLPPAEGQTAPEVKAKDTVITDPGEVDSVLAEVFGPAAEVK